MDRNDDFGRNEDILEDNDDNPSVVVGTGASSGAGLEGDDSFTSNLELADDFIILH